MHRESSQQDIPGRRRNSTPKTRRSQQRRLIPNGPLHRNLQTPNPHSPQRPPPRSRSRVHGETHLDSPSPSDLPHNGRDPDLRGPTHRRGQRPLRTPTSHLRQPARHTRRTRNRTNSHSRTHTPSPIRLQDDQRRLQQPRRQGTLHRSKQSTLRIHDPIRRTRLPTRRSIQRHQLGGSTDAAKSTERVLHPSTTNLRRNSHNPTRRNAPEKMGLRKRNQPLHRRRRMPPDSLEQPRTNLPRLRRKIPWRNNRLLPVPRTSNRQSIQFHIMASRTLQRRQST